jgi:hypothetical protein
MFLSYATEALLKLSSNGHKCVDGCVTSLVVVFLCAEQVVDVLSKLVDNSIHSHVSNIVLMYMFYSCSINH